jgi:alginate O-acetyltransferase complex protein AlgI
VLVGFFKKLVIADNAALAIELLDARPGATRGSVALLMVLLSVRILFDFSGYSDIAIGLARMLGLELPANFRYPYIARNIAEFWQRWHISLSRWIRDYIYIPLGGGRRGLLLKTVNLSIAMFLCGLWHGAAWHFGLWGLYHGFGLAAHSLWERSSLSRRLAGARFARWAGIAFTDAFVAFGWLLFFYPVERVAALTRALWGS